MSTLFVEEASPDNESRRPLLNTITSRENLSTCSLRLPSIPAGYDHEKVYSTISKNEI